MQNINKQQGLMLCAAGLLVVVMMTIFLRFVTTHIFVKKMHVENSITRLILLGDNSLLDNKPRDMMQRIEWSNMYPFSAEDNEKKRIWTPIRSVEGKVEKVKKRVGEWTGKHLLGYYKMTEAGRMYSKSVGWGLISPEQDIIQLDDGAWSFVFHRGDVSEKSTAIIDLARHVEQNGGRFLYIQAPFKVNPYGDLTVNGVFDFTNANCDELLSQLHARNISTMDMREVLYRWAQLDGCNYHDYFFRTDHHWKPETALRAAMVVGNKLREYGIPVDDSHYDLQAFDVEVLPEYFLGSQGKRATLARANPDDFPILHPKFPTKIHFEVPELNIDDVGDFEITYDLKEVSKKDYYNRNPYGMYGHADRAIVNIQNLLVPQSDKKVLIIRDSFCDTMGPFLSLGIRNVMLLDVRNFTGSVKEYIDECRPDVVVLMYTGIEPKDVDWSTHKDKFDFR